MAGAVSARNAFFRYFLQESRPLWETATERLKEPVVAFASLGAGGSLGGLWHRRGGGEPGAHEVSEGFIGDADVAFDALDVAVDPVEELDDGSLLPLVGIGPPCPRPAP